MRINWKLVFHIAFWTGLLTSLFGAFEIAYDLHGFVPDFHPIWSGLMGSPYVHHYLYGYVIAIMGYLGITYNDWTTAVRKIKARIA